MKLRLVIDHDSSTPQPWYRLEEWVQDKIRPGGDFLSDDGRWLLVTSGFEPSVRQVYEQLKKAGDHRTVVEEFDSSPIVKPQEEAQTKVDNSITIIQADRPD